MSQRIFANIFQKVLNEQDDIGEPAPDTQNLSDTEAAQSQLGSMPVDDLGAHDTAGALERKAAADAEMRLHMDGEIKGWITELDRIVDYLNGVGGHSIQTKLKSAIPDSIFDKIKGSEAKKIARVASEISKLSETLKGYAATSNSPSLKYV